MTPYVGRGTTKGWSETDIDRVYHPFPKDDAWKQVTLQGVIDEGKRLWLRCSGCERHAYVPALDFSDEHKIDPTTPVLLISRGVRCTRCGDRKVSVTVEPYAGKSRE
jgi:hypothetical protein